MPAKKHTHNPPCRIHRMQDQLIIFMALAQGESRMLCAEPTLHTRTAMCVAEALLPGVSFRVRPLGGTSGGGPADSEQGAPPQQQQQQQQGGLWLVECRGAGRRAGVFS